MQYGAVVFAISFFEGASTRYLLFMECHVHSSEVKSAFRQMERPPPAPAPPKGLSWDQKRLCGLARRNSGAKLEKLVSSGIVAVTLNKRNKCKPTSLSQIATHRRSILFTGQ